MLFCLTDRHWLIGDTMHPDALKKIADLETPQTQSVQTTEPVFEVPMFISHLNDVECREGDNAHFECRVEPSRDPTMKIGRLRECWKVDDFSLKLLC